MGFPATPSTRDLRRRSRYCGPNRPSSTGVARHRPPASSPCAQARFLRPAGLLGRTPSDIALGLYETFRPRISGRSGRCRADLHARFAEGVDRGWSHRRHRPRAGTGRKTTTAPDCAQVICPLARPVSAPTRWGRPSSRLGVDATRQTDLDHARRVAGGHRGRKPGRHRIGRTAQRATMSPRHFTRVFSSEVGGRPARHVSIPHQAARRQVGGPTTPWWQYRPMRLRDPRKPCAAAHSPRPGYRPTNTRINTA